MQLKIQRSQRMGGVLGNTVVFCLDVRADYSAEEQNNIRRYKMGSYIIYNSRAARKHIERVNAQADRAKHGSSWGEMAAGAALSWTSVAMAKMSLNISIGSLGRGHHIECKDLDELLEAEDTVRNACKNVTRHLEVAATFDGSEVVIEYDRGEENVHILQNAPPLIVYAPEGSSAPLPPNGTASEPSGASSQARGADTSAAAVAPSPSAFWQQWLAVEQKILAYTAAKGWNLRQDHLRALALLGGVAIFILLLSQL